MVTRLVDGGSGQTGEIVPPATAMYWRPPTSYVMTPAPIGAPVIQLAYDGAGFRVQHDEPPIHVAGEHDTARCCGDTREDRHCGLCLSLVLQAGTVWVTGLPTPRAIGSPGYS